MTALHRAFALVAVLWTIPVGCAATPLMSTTELVAAHGTRSYEAVEAATMLEVSSAALATLGYEVTYADPDTGIVKTAPKLVVVEQIGLQTGAVTSVTTSRNAIAWTLQIESQGEGVSVTATPRGFANGQPVPPTTPWDPAYMSNALGSLFAEIDSMLPAAAAG